MGASGTDTRRWRLWIVACSAAAIVILAVTAWALVRPGMIGADAAGSTATPGPDESSAAPLDLPAPTPGVITEEPAEVEKATEAASAVIEAQNQIAQRADGSAIGAEMIATGFVLGELQSYAQEQRDLGYRQTGEARVTQVTVQSVDLTAAVPVMTLAVCVDVSGIDVVDAAGNSYKAALYNPGHPVKHIYGAEFADGTWKISTHDIPDEQDCPAAS